VNVSRQQDLTPRCKKFYKLIAEWGRRTATFQHSIRSLRGRLRNAEKVATCSCFNTLIDSVNETTYNFILQQEVRTQKQNPYARRFTLNDKLLALSLYKTSPKGYRLLSSIFSLPSRRTLSILLNRIPYGPGINTKIWESLKATVTNIKVANDRLCAAVFDEVSIRPLLSYNKRTHCIEGVEDYGRNNRTPAIAEYANVFMLKEIHRQWKQAISFTFSHDPIKTLKLKSLLVEVIKKGSRNRSGSDDL
jgi:hypothetical protein